MDFQMKVSPYIVAAVFLVGIAIIVIITQRKDLEYWGIVLSRCRPIRVPELVPSSGLRWSRERYPEQYEEDNWKQVKLQPVEEAGTKPFRSQQRYMDVAGRAFSRDFNSQFRYQSDASWSPQVTLKYLKEGETFTGRLEATGLKPNFAYQMKIKGVYDHKEAFERIGYTGRWRLPGGGTNFSDADYESCPRKEEAQSYLFFDYFVTDSRGRTVKEFYLDSSLHVLFNATWQRAPDDTDTRRIRVVPGRSDSRIYARPVSHVDPQRIYAESESEAPSGNRRPPVGEVFLPPGRYRAQFQLTEESFHGFGDAGYWATVMYAPLDFEITDRKKPPTGEWTEITPVNDLALSEGSVHELDIEYVDETMLKGRLLKEDGSVTLAERLEAPPEGRYVLRMDVLVEGEQQVAVVADTGDGFETGPRYSARSKDCEGWREFQFEVTGSVAGKAARIRLFPRQDKGPVGVRNVSLCRVDDR